ncbi:glycoside hydrolase family 36 protein [Streptomyces sp. NPDC091212]|uniref:glycoside hydrolase family 36 protein n=1 Tax=Streptomyces sp. NPDC091212 TaxID=3155191 RepID=UPI0034427C06
MGRTPSAGRSGIRRGTLTGQAANHTRVKFTWGHSALETEFATAPDGTLRMTRLARPDDSAVLPAAPGAPLPLVEISALGHGSGWSGQRFLDGALGSRLRYRAHRAVREGDWHRLGVELHDPDSGLTAEVRYSSPDGVSVLRGEVRLRNEGARPLVVQSVSSLVVGTLPSPDSLDVHRARNDWLAECRWYREPLRDTVAALNHEAHEHDSRAALSLAGRGSWPSDGHLPMGGLTEHADGTDHRANTGRTDGTSDTGGTGGTHRAGGAGGTGDTSGTSGTHRAGGAGGTDHTAGRAWLWQIESAAGWRWDTGERAGSSYLALNGPTDAEHQWRERLGPGEEFTTVPAALALGSGFEDALAHLTSYRRAIRRPHRDHTALPVIFNDYMNTLMGDPTTEKLLPLIDAAAEAGAEYFCIDSGWYDDDAKGWWDSVGAWLPSDRRFPGGGIQVVLGRIRERGMVPGLWLEPEVVGVRSPVAETLPADAFFQRDGVRITEHGRHQLDLRHPAARAHLDGTIDRIVGEWGVGYLKLDYNIAVAPGTQGPGDVSPGGGLLGHTRAYLDWLSTVLDRYPDLVVENCASGGMRMDGASLAVAQIQSTSDQQDPLYYPPIAASAPTAVPPEQGAVWAYPQPEYSADEISFTLGGALLGRIHLSGHLDRMSPDRLALVQQAVTAYKTVRGDLPGALPFWPLGLPGWADDWCALGLRAGGTTYLSVWRRDGSTGRVLPVPHLAGRDVRAEILHPAAPAGSARWLADRAELAVELPAAPACLLVRLSAAAPAEARAGAVRTGAVPTGASKTFATDRSL